MSGVPRLPACDETLTMTPRLWVYMMGSTARVQRITPLRLTARMRSISSSEDVNSAERRQRSLYHVPDAPAVGNVTRLSHDATAIRQLGGCLVQPLAVAVANDDGRAFR